MTTSPEQLEILPLISPPDVTVSIPGSKSLTNRALILASLADGESTLHNALDSEDTQVMLEGLRRLGFTVSSNVKTETMTVCGTGGVIPALQAELFCGNSGTSIRFLTALCALGNGEYGLDGVERMRLRPQQDLLDALTQLGANTKSDFDNGCPPLTVKTQGLHGGNVLLSAEASTQFVSALLMVAPYAHTETTIKIEGNLRPHYVELTRNMMRQWGVLSEVNDEGTFRVKPGQRYHAQSAYSIEPDASGASYFFAAAALTGGRVTVPGLGSGSLQGDVRFATEVLAEMGCEVSENEEGLTVKGAKLGHLRGIERDMSAISDTALTLAAIAPFANSPTLITGIAHSREQECDRVSAVCTELRKLGVEVDEFRDGYRIYPLSSEQTMRPALIETYRDHRVAMSFALIGLKAPGIVISDPGCVAKTFPDYWNRLDLLRSELKGKN